MSTKVEIACCLAQESQKACANRLAQALMNAGLGPPDAHRDKIQEMHTRSALHAQVVQTSPDGALRMASSRSSWKLCG